MPGQGQVDAARLLLDKGAEIDKGAERLYLLSLTGHAVRLLLDEAPRSSVASWTPLWRVFLATSKPLGVLDSGAELDGDGGRARCLSRAGRTRRLRGCAGQGSKVDQAIRTVDVSVCRVTRAPRRREAAGERRGGRSPKKGATPLFIACHQGHVDARLLLDKGAEVDRAQKDGATPCTSPAQGQVAARRCCWTKARRATSTRRGCCWRKARNRAGDGDGGRAAIACQGPRDVRGLLEKGAEVDRAARTVDAVARLPEGHVDAVRLLLE